MTLKQKEYSSSISPKGCLRGPGLFLIMPVIDRAARFIDTRIRATDFRAETTLTRDTVPVNVDAIAFWMIWDAEKATLEVEDYLDALILSAPGGASGRDRQARPFQSPLRA